MVSSKSYKEGRGSTTLSRKSYYSSSRTSRESEMPDIRTVRAKSMKEAMALAAIEYGRDFSILNNKTVKTGGVLGIGKKEEIELRIMLLHNRTESNKASKIESDKKEIKKHEPIDGKEIGQRLLQIRQNIENANALKNNNVDESEISIVANDSINNNYISSKNSYTKEYIASDNVALRQYANDDINPSINNIYNTVDMAEERIAADKNIIKGSKKTEDVYSYIDNRMESFENKILSALLEIKENGKTTEGQPSKQLEITENFDNSLSDYDRDNNYNTYNRKADRIRKTKEQQDLEDLENSNMAQMEINRLNSLEKNSIHMDIEKSKLDNKNSVIDKALDGLKKKEFPEETIEEIRNFLINTSNARFIQSDKVVREEIERYFDEGLILKNGVQVGTKKKIVILVGPTGVGKTTTIPKLAAPHIRAKKDVSFITIDNYRIAAGEQLAKYASIIKVPFTSIKSPEDLRNEVRKMGQNGILFIDTVGRSPKATRDIVDMSKYFSSIGRFDIDINLLISATSKYSDALNILEKFKVTNYKNIIITKMDETVYLAPVISAIMKNKVPISNITYGQAVPSDISDAVKGRNRIIKGIHGGVM